MFIHRFMLADGAKRRVRHQGKLAARLETDEYEGFAGK
jgi:hypothetical protein